MPETRLTFDDLLAQLAAHAQQVDIECTWPTWQVGQLAAAGVLQWSIPAEFGGAPATADVLLAGYVRLARACLTTTFILTQRNGACQRIADSANEPLRAKLLPALACGDLWATVGISHLSTSRQHQGTPAVRVEKRGSGYCFSGAVPWVTGAAHADYIVTGGTLADGRQVLAAIPARQPRVRIHAAMSLLALTASHTAEVELDAVEIDERELLAGPTEQIMQAGSSGGAGSLATSALAIGAAQMTLERLHHEASARLELLEVQASLAEECAQIERDLYQVLSSGATGQTAGEIRARANSLVLRSSQALLAASKGAGFVAGHPAGRAVREALFFLVWSCPQPVLAASLREFAGSAAPQQF